MDYYRKDVDEIGRITGRSIEVLENDTDLYYHMAWSMHAAIERSNSAGRPTTCILPVGPVFQYRKFILLLKQRPLDLSRLHIFFMDEYLADRQSEDAGKTGSAAGGSDDVWIDIASPLSFRGFIERELIQPMPKGMGLNRDQLHFPRPSHTAEFDAQIERLGGIDFCHAGVGIVGHLAFNEPMSADAISGDDFARLPSRIVTLTEGTRTINAVTALQGAVNAVPRRAVTIGMRQILESRRLVLYFNRSWQNTVWRRALLDCPGPEFPVTLTRKHPELACVMTAAVAKRPDFALA